MNDTYEYVEDQSISIQHYVNHIFKWMVLGVAITFLTAFGLERTSFVYDAGLIPLIAIVLQLFVAVRIARHLLSMKASTMKFLYIAYSVLTGMTFSIVISCYTAMSVTLAFLVAAIYFGALVIVGTVLKKDLTKIGTICYTGLFVYIIFSIIAMIFNLGISSLLLPLISLVLFAGITAYDMQKAIQFYYQAQSNNEMLTKLSIYGAFTLYLDFVNIFLDILQLLGKEN